MTQTIKWVKNFQTNVGSVLIYRATSKTGTYSLLTTIGAKDGSGNWVGSYNDSGGNVDSWYKIQTWDGTGSSALSDPISGEFWYMLSEIDDVKDVLRLTSLANVSDSEIYNAIVDADDEIYGEYGDPIEKTYSYFYSGSYTYDITGDRTPIYRVDRVEFENAGGVGERMETGSYSVDTRDGYVTFTDTAVVETNNGRRVEFEFVPKLFHSLSKFKAALDIAESNLITDGENSRNPDINRLQKKIDRIHEQLKPQGLYNASEIKSTDPRGPGKWVDQQFVGNPY